MERRSFLSVVAGGLLAWLPPRKPSSPWDELRTALNDGGHHHIVVRRDRDSVEVFLDGKPLKSLRTKCVLSITCESDCYPCPDGALLTNEQYTALRSAMIHLINVVTS